MWMYHVTNQRERPTWNRIRCSVANDITFDGDILGLPLASFTTTLYSNHGEIGLPTISPYPRRTEQGMDHYRVKIRFNKDDYHIFLMADSRFRAVTQYHLLCIRKDGRDRFENELYGILLQHYGEKELDHERLNIYFPGGMANIYNRDMFVNVHFAYEVNIENGIWDTVLQRGAVGEIDEPLNHINLEILRVLWCLKHLSIALNSQLSQLNREDETIEHVRGQLRNLIRILQQHTVEGITEQLQDVQLNEDQA